MTMPSYNLINNETGEEYVEYMSYSELEVYLKENSNVTQQPSAPAIVSGRGMRKVDSNFRDLLKNIKKGNSKGFTRSTVNVDR